MMSSGADGNHTLVGPTTGWVASLLLTLGGLMQVSPCLGEEPVSGESTIRAKALGSEIVIKTTSRTAGAIDSLTWNGVEFIDSFDHGRQLQSASNFDLGRRPIHAETYNPTEAGCRRDGKGPLSTSRLLHLSARENQLQTTSQMAFWLEPGEFSGPHPARNQTRLSNHLLTKRVTIGARGLENVLDYRVTFHLPLGEHHNHAVFEILTGYMPAQFSVFWKLDPEQGLQPLDDGPGEQRHPVILATPDGRYAMGCLAPQVQSDNGPQGITYGRFRFPREQVVKWNAVTRLNGEHIHARDYQYQVYVAVGTLADVEKSLTVLRDMFPQSR